MSFEIAAEIRFAAITQGGGDFLIGSTLGEEGQGKAHPFPRQPSLGSDLQLLAKTPFERTDTQTGLDCERRHPKPFSTNDAEHFFEVEPRSVHTRHYGKRPAMFREFRAKHHTELKPLRSRTFPKWRRMKTTIALNEPVYILGGGRTDLSAARRTKGKKDRRPQSENSGRKAINPERRAWKARPGHERESLAAVERFGTAGDCQALRGTL